MQSSFFLLFLMRRYNKYDLCIAELVLRLVKVSLQGKAYVQVVTPSD